MQVANARAFFPSLLAGFIPQILKACLTQASQIDPVKVVKFALPSSALALAASTHARFSASEIPLGAPSANAAQEGMSLSRRCSKNVVRL